MLRGWLALIVTTLLLFMGEVVQRVVIAPMVRLRPSKRIPVLAGWMKIMAWATTRPAAFFTGCMIPRPERFVPGRPGVLVLMNHQSLFDIPLVIQTLTESYPRIVTRARYAQRIPVISHMIKLYEYPLVDPSANAAEVREALDRLEAAAASSEVPIVVFPEGTRTKDGEIGRFRRGGLSRILGARDWTVYVVVVDGFWRAAKFKDFVRGLPHIRGRVEHVATLDWPDPGRDPLPFLDHVRELMVAHLQGMRDGVPRA